MSRARMGLLALPLAGMLAFAAPAMARDTGVSQTPQQSVQQQATPPQATPQQEQKKQEETPDCCKCKGKHAGECNLSEQVQAQEEAQKADQVEGKGKAPKPATKTTDKKAKTPKKVAAGGL